MNLNPKKIHMIGICGTAMGSVAAMLKSEHYTVSGSDHAIYPPMSDVLRSAGIKILDGYSPDHLENRPDLVVVGNAISRGNPELEKVLDDRIPYISLPETLKWFFLNKTHNLVVTGTHGKTTTTSLLAWIFEHAGKQPSFMIGGVPLNFGQGCQRQDGHFWILEGDEYDTSFFDKRSKFLHYLPELVIINNLEYDHADIYDSLDAIKLSFRRLVNIVPQNGMILVNADDPHAVDVVSHARSGLLEVGFSSNAAVRITDVSADSHGTSFRIYDHRFTIPLYGAHNVRNAAMAAAAAHSYQIHLDVIDSAFRSFKGIKRRLEVVAEIQGITLVDDFGHHPTALRETINALRQKFPGRRIHALFEPRSNTTRRSVFQNDLPPALALADSVVLGAVARMDQLPPDQRLDPEKLRTDIESLGKPCLQINTPEEIVSTIRPSLRQGDVVAVFSNGSFGGILSLLEKALKEG